MRNESVAFLYIMMHSLTAFTDPELKFDSFSCLVWLGLEPRGSSQDSFEAVLKGYYNSVRHGTKKVSGRKIRGKKLGLKNGNAVESTKDIKKEGAAFLAVCRGKVI